MPKEIIVIGDIEIGAGNLTDDFISDHAFSEFMHTLTKKDHPVDLVLNGDTFDFLKCPSKVGDIYTYPRHITVDISLNKLTLMHAAHKNFFDSLQKFVRKRSNHLYFTLGNHDQDLLFLEVREEIRKLLGGSKRIHFPGLKYQQHGVYVEHGHQYDFLSKINFQNLFLNYKGKPILNFPWTAFSLISTFMDIKEQHPFMERITPRPLLLSFNSMVLRKINLRSLGYFLKTVLYYPFRYYSDPTYNLPTKLFGLFYYRWKNKQWDEDNIVDVFRKKKKKVKHQVYVLGHVHKVQMLEQRKRVIIHPGSWRDEYELNAETRMLMPKDKFYVQVLIHDDGHLEYNLNSWPIKRSVFLFDDVRKHELAYIYLAAQEEKYEPTL